MTLQQGIDFIKQVVAVGRNAVERCEALADGERNVSRATGTVEAQGTCIVLLPWRWAQLAKAQLDGGVVGIGQPDQPLLLCWITGAFGPYGAVDPMPLPSWSALGSCINGPSEGGLDAAPVIELVASGWVAVAELEQQMQRLRRWRLVGAPVAKGWLAVPELFELLEAQFDHLAGFGGA